MHTAWGSVGVAGGVNAEKLHTCSLTICDCTMPHTLVVTSQLVALSAPCSMPMASCRHALVCTYTAITIPSLIMRSWKELTGSRSDHLVGWGGGQQGRGVSLQHCLHQIECSLQGWVNGVACPCTATANF